MNDSKPDLGLTHPDPVPPLYCVARTAYQSTLDYTPAGGPRIKVEIRVVVSSDLGESAVATPSALLRPLNAVCALIANDGLATAIQAAEIASLSPQPNPDN